MFGGITTGLLKFFPTVCTVTCNPTFLQFQHNVKRQKMLVLNSHISFLTTQSELLITSVAYSY